jgi:ERCC4-related helicase
MPTMKTEPLLKHQEQFLKLNPNKHLMCWEMGTAKTRTSIEWTKLHPLGSVLVICPKGLKIHWAREILKWDDANFMRYRVMSKEEFRRDYDTLKWYDTIIIDEAHYFAGMTSQMSKAMLQYIKMNQPKRIVALTGTPYMRNAWNVFRLGQILGRNWHYPDFERTFFRQIRMGHRWIPQQRVDDESKRLLAQHVLEIGSTKKLSDCADVPVSQELVERFPMTPEQKKELEQIRDIEPIVKYTKHHQIMGGTLRVDGFPTKVFSSEKMNRVVDIAEEAEKVIIVCRYNHELEVLAEKLKTVTDNVFIINGSVEPADRDKILETCKKLDSFALLVNAKCSEGWELPQVMTMVFYSHDFSLKDYIQMKGRIQRINFLRPRVYLHLTVEGGIDDSVYESLMNKQDFHINIYAEQERRKTDSV